jgi:hypothetical protein
VPEDIVFECGDITARSVSCTDHPDFGASFATGDLDGDGSNEVAIGAPNALVSDRPGAGSVFLYDPGSPASPLNALHDAVPVKNQKLGLSLAISPVAGQDEVIAGAPGTDEVFVFFCSGVGGDTPAATGTARCR